jgi:hypothetical protein
MDFCDSTRKEDIPFISDTKMRTLARNGEKPPDGGIFLKCRSSISVIAVFNVEEYSYIYTVCISRR